MGVYLKKKQIDLQMRDDHRLIDIILHRLHQYPMAVEHLLQAQATS